MQYLEDGDFCKSFPSGHTTIAINAATFLTYMLYYYDPDNCFNLPIALSSYILATSTAALRITSGMHFVTDVLGGAALGTLTGLLVPLFHYRSKNETTDKIVFTFTPGRETTFAVMIKI